MAPLARQVPEELVDLLEGGVSILVGTSDPSLRCEAIRACGASLSADRRRVTVFLPDATAARTLANLEVNPEIAVGFSRPVDHLSIQLKGRCAEIRVAREDEHEATLRYRAGYAEQLYFVGLPRSVTSRLNVWPAHAVTFDVRDIFVQTPGPEAGKRL
jgi:hypothetical protein